MSRRRALTVGALGLAGAGTAGLAGLAGCGAGGRGETRLPPTDIPVEAATLALLGAARTCRPSRQLAQGPYWFDVDRLRSDIRESRQGTTLQLALRVVDGAGCGARPVPGAVVEVWNCDATGRYSGFEGAGRSVEGQTRPGRPAPPTRPAPPGPPLGWPNPLGVELPAGDPTADPMGYANRTSDGSYSRGDAEAQPGDESTYLRGAQIADRSGVVRFTTIYPGWYVGRAPHLHAKVYRDRRTVLSTQLFLDDAVSDRVYAAAPYRPRDARSTRNASDALFEQSTLLTLARYGDAYLGAINLAVDLLDVPPGAAGPASGGQYPGGVQ
ncbi:dioxygenase family protein [Cryptosporangium minutisporangium]|uniref:Protocatechuate dioxygenase n=1 Tax=Cryptosporangium minutisporangium TaxID=113569 RepID=A0ABP6SVT3_9ACTN